MDTTYTLARNEQYNSLEISFAGKPSETVRAALKALRFRWHGVKKVWYGRADEQTVRAALDGAQPSADPAGSSAGRPSAGTPQNVLRILYNGMKVNGTLHRCHYSLNDDSVSVFGKDYEHIPRGFFPVRNDSDCMTDYFENDSASVPASHPLYRYFVYAAHKADAISDKGYIRTIERRMAKPGDYYARHPEQARQEIERHAARLAAFEAMTDPGQPTREDLDAIERMNQEAEAARIRAEQEAERLRLEKHERRTAEGRALIIEQMNTHPLKAGEPVVLIRWSEHPAFYAWPDDTLELSVAAAEIILRKFDADNHNDPDFGGYDKTSFTISGTGDDGEPFTYEGRYDLGDGEGGMVEHIRRLGEWELTHDTFGHVKDQPDETNGRLEFAAFLRRFTV